MVSLQCFPPLSQLVSLLIGCPDQSRQKAAQLGWQLLPLLPPFPPLFHPSILSTLPLLCAQPRDLICLVISGLACSAQLHSKVKLDKGIGASPCKTASPWQLLEWAADCRRVEEEGREEKCVGGRRMYLRGRQTPIHFSLFHRGDLCQGREPATKTEAVQSEDKAPGATGDQLSTQQHAGASPVRPVSFQWDPDRWIDLLLSVTDFSYLFDQVQIFAL